DAEAEKAGAEFVCPADRNGAPVQLDDPSRDERAEDRAGLAVDQHRIRLLQRRDLAVDVRRHKRASPRGETDHRDIEPDPASRIAMKIPPMASAVRPF